MQLTGDNGENRGTEMRKNQFLRIRERSLNGETPSTTRNDSVMLAMSFGLPCCSVGTERGIHAASLPSLKGVSVCKIPFSLIVRRSGMNAALRPIFN